MLLIFTKQSENLLQKDRRYRVTNIRADILNIIRPYNDFYSQVKFDPQTGQILEIYDQPSGATDAVAMQHDVDYLVCKDDKKWKNDADKRTVKLLDKIPYKQGHPTRNFDEISVRESLPVLIEAHSP